MWSKILPLATQLKATPPAKAHLVLVRGLRASLFSRRKYASSSTTCIEAAISWCFLPTGSSAGSGLPQPLFEVGGKELAQHGSLAVFLPGHLRPRSVVAEVVKPEGKPLAVAGLDNAAKLIHVGGFAVRRQPHHLVFVPELPEPQVLAERRVIETQANGETPPLRGR